MNFGTEDAPAETPVIATGESATAETAAQDEKIAKAAEKLTLAWTSSDESVATVDETGTVTAIAAGEAEITAAVKDTEMQDVCVITVKVSAKELKVPDTLDVDVYKRQTDNSKREGLALKVSELQAEPATWRVVPMSTSALKRGEIAMSIAPDSAMYNASAIDLAKCSAPLDITENGWFLAAPTEVTKTGAAADAVTHDAAKALPLIVNAKIAGSNVNDAGCTPVVREMCIRDRIAGKCFGGGICTRRKFQRMAMAEIDSGLKALY